jgi:hypothetical protein
MSKGLLVVFSIPTRSWVEDMVQDQHRPATDIDCEPGRPSNAADLANYRKHFDEDGQPRVCFSDDYE